MISVCKEGMSSDSCKSSIRDKHVSKSLRAFCSESVSFLPLSDTSERQKRYN